MRAPPRRHRHLSNWALAVAIGVAGAAAPAAAMAQAPATRPADRADRADRGDRRGDAGGPLVRAREVLDGLDLTDGQRERVDAILAAARDDFRALRDELQTLEPRERAAQAREFVVGVHAKLAEVLSDEQRQTFRDQLGRGRPADGPGPDMGPRPDLGPGPRGDQVRPGAMAERLAEVVRDLDLSPEQEDRARAVLDDLKRQGDEIRAAIRSGDEMAREQAGAMLLDARQKLGQILTPEQQRRFRERMREPRGGGDGGPPMMGPDEMTGDRPGRPGRPRNRRGDAGDGMMEMDKPAGGDRPAGASASPAPETPMPEVGAPAPAFDLKTLDGRVVRPSSFKGRVLVLVFGSYSSPSFRQRAAALEQLRKDYAGRGVQFLVVYTTEAHPAGEWDVERNKDDGVAVTAHADADARAAQAERARDALKLTVPFATDGMADEAFAAYGRAPNGAVLIGRDGTVVARQRWFDPGALRRHIDQAVKTPIATTRPGA
jgi:Spy/CpxP family protein refolding chaperone